MTSACKSRDGLGELGQEGAEEADALLRRLEGNLGPHRRHVLQDDPGPSVGERLRARPKTGEDRLHPLRERGEVVEDEEVDALLKPCLNPNGSSRKKLSMFDKMDVRRCEGVELSTLAENRSNELVNITKANGGKQDRVLLDAETIKLLSGSF